MKSMQRRPRLLRERVGLARDDAGLSIIEVLVAFLIFSIVAIGVAQGMVTAVRLSADQRARTVALNLAASEIDRVRAVSDAYTITTGTQPDRTIGGTSFSVRREASWVTSTGADIACGAGDEDFQLKRIRVVVEWNSRLDSTAEVASDTLISPNGQITDPALGTIMISVKRANGSPYVNAPVTVTATSGGAPVTVPRTDSDGCTYALGVVTGTYDVRLSIADHLDPKQQPAPVVSLDVDPGETESAEFAYDVRSQLRPTYVPGIAGAFIPPNLQTTYFTDNATVRRSGTPATVDVYPWESHAVVAGTLVAPTEASAGCVSVNPAEWRAATVLGVGLRAGVRPPAVPTPPGSTPAATVPLAVLETRVPNGGGNRFLTVRNVNPVAGSSAPNCIERQTYTFPTAFTNNQTVRIALPYGTWTVYAGATAGATTTAINSQALTNSYPSVAATVTTLDPRART